MCTHSFYESELLCTTDAVVTVPQLLLGGLQLGPVELSWQSLNLWYVIYNYETIYYILHCIMHEVDHIVQ